MRSDYQTFLEGKIKHAPSSGFEIDPAIVNPRLKEHIRAIVPWGIKGGRRAFFLNFGLGKTGLQVETMRILGRSTGEPTLITLPLGVRQEFTGDVGRFFKGEHATAVKFIRSADEIEPGHSKADPHPIYLTNYEPVRDGKLDPGKFVAASLDEAAVLRSYGSKTYQEFLPLYSAVPYRFVATATPSPNRLKELIHYAGFLGVMDTGQALTRFFQRNSEKANDLTLYPHKSEEFWLWVHSWGIFLQKPSNICGCTSCRAENNFSQCDSAGSLSRHGAPANFVTAPGFVAATAATPSSPGQRTSRAAESSAVDVFDPSTAAREQSSTFDGKECSIDAETPTTRIGETTAGVASRSASAGIDTKTSSPTSGNLKKGRRSTGSTTTETTSRATSDGRPEQSRPTTAALIDHIASPAQCRCDEGYELPPMEVRWHEVPTNHAAAGSDQDGQSLMFRDAAAGLQAAAAEKRDSLPARLAKLVELRTADPTRHVVLWHDLEAEREAIEKAIPQAASIYGAMELEDRERRLIEFSEGRLSDLATKPILSGSGCNFQGYCSWEIFLGVGYKFHDFIQSIHRVWRYGQKHPVRIDIIYTEAERDIVKDLQRKWAEHETMQTKMAAIIRRYGLDHGAAAERLKRSIGVERRVIESASFTVALNDCVDEASRMLSDSVGGIITSIPFANQYEYTPSYNDFGHTESNDQFWRQMDHLTPELLRILQPGRLACIHVKDRILFGNVTGQGVPTVSPFHAEAIFHYLAHDFQFMGMIQIVTDVVRENNQTYRLGYSEMLKDGTKMGVGSPEYVLLMRKPQSDRSRGYADAPVTKTAGEYSLARWQVDAHAFWRSSGNRLLTADELIALGPKKLASYFPKWSLYGGVYDYEKHVGIGEEIESRRPGAMPRTFMALAPGSHDPSVWHDVNRMLTLNNNQAMGGREKHVCLARGSLVLTKKGYKEIQSVRVGDLVLTHKGRWRPVLAVKNTGIRPVVTLKAQGVPGLTLTPEHKVWTRKVRDLSWSRAHSKKEATAVKPGWARADKTVGSYVNLKLPEIEEATQTDDRLWWIVGRWLADGHIGGRGEVMLSCGRHEHNEVLHHLGDLAGSTRHDLTALQIRIRDRSGALRSILARCGKGAKAKHLPPEAFTLPRELAGALLAGYLSGDGHYVSHRRRWTASSVSKELLLGVAMLAQRVHGAIASVYPGRSGGLSTILGRKVTTSPDWVLCFDLQREGGKRSPMLLDDGAWKKVRSTEVAGKAETWCLRVAEDESFTAEGCIVKNCPLQFDIIDRLIERYSNAGDVIFDPFGGIMSVPYRAILKKRRGAAAELNADYFRDGVRYLRAAEAEVDLPDLFGLPDEKEAA